MHYKGKQTGYLWTDGTGMNGLYIEVEEYGTGVDFCRIANGQREMVMRPAILKDVYDERQGNMVSGIWLTDATGQPTGEKYKMRDFQMSGNLQADNPYGF